MNTSAEFLSQAIADVVVIRTDLSSASCGVDGIPHRHGVLSGAG